MKSVLAMALLGTMPRALAQVSTAANTAALRARFDLETVPRLAQAMAKQPFRAPDDRLPAALAADYDAYRDLRFDPEQAIWRREALPFQLQMFHRGFLFKQRVDLHLVHDGVATPLVYSPEMFSLPPGVGAELGEDTGFAGFRVHAPLNRATVYDELIVFLGASYFRALGKGHLYGLSARGLALGSGDPGAEEFPVFRAFWIELPASGADHLAVHALLDSPSVTGAFRFAIRPGGETIIDVQSRLYPRVDLARAGIAPLTSMFEFDAGDRVGIDDYRPAVHDSDGLAILNGAGEQIWRPLGNPPRVRISGFADARPKGFGLMQRKRHFADYADTEARYHQRPSLWIEPVGDWGDGAVTLVEIPTADEYHDNIVAFWRPQQPLRAGREYRFDYRMHWCDTHRWEAALATVGATRIGAAPDVTRRLVVIDLEGGRLASIAHDTTLTPDVWAAHGDVVNAVAYPNPEAGGWRLSFEFRPHGDGHDVELHARVLEGHVPLSETWLYRWSPP
ncbi:glucan biosynthesis protein [Pseudoxanthomonas japonensis]|uniref:glucan biosynthesis protein n=1 Tax=Pseudoxanthomonas japonensis TaxID=69284 RepID=UPI001BD02932|nr:glucan biosynthesis protein G [Pseudoxanthomonas japonensis]